MSEKRKTHKVRLLEYLQRYGAITQMESTRDLGNTRLAGAIHQLKQCNVPIVTKSKKVQTRFKDDNGDRLTTIVCEYSLGPNGMNIKPSEL